jgi:hypothetical protein
MTVSMPKRLGDTKREVRDVGQANDSMDVALDLR